MERFVDLLAAPRCLGTTLRKNRPLVPRSNSCTPFFYQGIGVFMVLVDVGQLFRCAGHHFMCVAYGSPHHSFGVHLSTWLTVGKERARMSRRNAPENFFSAVRGCPRSCARTNPWFRSRILGGKRAQEPPASSAVKHCRFLGTGGGGGVKLQTAQTAICRGHESMGVI